MFDINWKQVYPPPKKRWFHFNWRLWLDIPRNYWGILRDTWASLDHWDRVWLFVAWLMVFVVGFTS